MASNKNNNANESVIDVIMEQTANIEQSTNQRDIKKALSEAIRLNGKRERALRASTIMFKKGSDEDAVIKAIDEKWVDAKKEVGVTTWKDKEQVYCQFISCEVKNAFLEQLMMENFSPVLKEALIKPNEKGETFIRKAVRLCINNVKGNIRAEKVKEVLEKLTSANGYITDFKEGKPDINTRSRGLFFRVNSQGFLHIFKEMDGAIPYQAVSSNIKTRLVIKINAKPWQCKDCFRFGQHMCEGALCAQCGQKGHRTRECQSKTRFCVNCKRKGHRSKDSHCSAYLNEVGKEIRKMDLPIEYLEEEELRFTLLKYLQYK